MNKKLIILFTLTLFSVSKSCHSQTFPDTYFESSYGKLEYGFFIPEDYDSTQAYPLLMYLHGMGNNYSVYLDWYDRNIQAKNPCFVYTPKTPISWADWSSWSDYLTEPMIAALHVMDSLITVYSVDVNRLYVYGISMGGEGVFDLLDKFPGKFAAAMSVCGGGQPSWAENISQTPFWMFHGSADNINPPLLTEQVYEELVRIGAKKMRYKNYPGYGHEIWNIAVGEPSWHDWMFAHSKNDTSCPRPTGKIELKSVLINADKIQLSWNDIRDSDEKANQIWYYKIFDKDGLAGTAEYDETESILPIVHPVDTFKVKAVNYHFKESDESNMIFNKNGSILTGVKDNGKFRPQQLNLRNFPNPFNPATRISYSIPHPGHVAIIISDLLGRTVTTLIDEEKPTGEYSIGFDGSSLSIGRQSLSSGIYFYRLEMDGTIETRKMLLLR